MMATGRRSSVSTVLRNSISTYGIVWFTAALFIGLALTTDRFLSEANLRNVLDQQSTLLIAASAATITMIAGGFDLSISATAITAPLVTLRVENATGNIPLAVLAGVLTGVAIGVVNGVVVSYLRINAFIATLATSFIVFGIGFIVSDRSILRADNPDFTKLARTRWLGITTATWIALVVVIVAWAVLTRTRFGQHVFATGGNPEAAMLAGVRVRLITASTFAIAGLGAGMAGVLRASRATSAQASDDFSFIFGVIAAIVVGGTSIAGGEGAIWRTVIGAAVIAFMVNGLNLHQIDPIYQRFIQGAVILVAVGIDTWSGTARSPRATSGPPPESPSTQPAQAH